MTRVIELRTKNFATKEVRWNQTKCHRSSEEESREQGNKLPEGMQIIKEERRIHPAKKNTSREERKIVPAMKARQ